MADRFHDLRIGEGRDIARAGEVRDAGHNAAHDLPRTCLRHIRHYPHVFRPSNPANDRLDRAGDATLSFSGGRVTRLQCDIHLDGSAPELVHHGYRRRLGDLLDGQAGGLELFSAQTVTGDVDHVIDAAQNAKVAIRGLDSAIASEIRPVSPILALTVLAVLLVIGRHVTFWLAPNSLKNAGP